MNVIQYDYYILMIHEWKQIHVFFCLFASFLFILPQLIWCFFFHIENKNIAYIQFYNVRETNALRTLTQQLNIQPIYEFSFECFIIPQNKLSLTY